MAIGLRCDTCLQPFDTLGRRPKILPCGHTFCFSCVLTCIENVDSWVCPEDAKTFPLKTLNVVDNRYIISKVEENAMKKMYECERVPPRPDAMWTALERLERRLRVELEEQLPELRRRVASCLEEALAEPEQRVTHMRASLARLRHPVPDASGEAGVAAAVARKREKREAARRLAAEDRAALLRELEVLGREELCVTASYGNTDAEAIGRWVAEHLQLRGHPALRLAALQLQQQQRLYFQQRRRQEDIPREDTLNLVNLSVYGPNEKTEEKEAALRQNPAVREIVGLSCDADPAWALSLLKQFAGQLLRVQLLHVSAEHLQVLWEMPRLQQLHVMFASPSLMRCPELHLPEDRSHTSRNVRKQVLEWLPVETLRPLLCEWRDSLLELRLRLSFDAKYRNAGAGDYEVLSDAWMDSVPGLLKEADYKFLERFYFDYSGNEQVRKEAAEALLPDDCEVDCRFYWYDY